MILPSVFVFPFVDLPDRPPGCARVSISYVGGSLQPGAEKQERPRHPHPTSSLAPHQAEPSDVPSGHTQLPPHPCQPAWLLGEIPWRSCSVTIPQRPPRRATENLVSLREAASPSYLQLAPSEMLLSSLPPCWGAVALLAFRTKLHLPQSSLRPPPPNLPSTLQPREQLLSLGGP